VQLSNQKPASTYVDKFGQFKKFKEKDQDPIDRFFKLMKKVRENKESAERV
jgi:hypothetical protein